MNPHTTDKKERKANRKKAISHIVFLMQHSELCRFVQLGPNFIEMVHEWWKKAAAEINRVELEKLPTSQDISACLIKQPGTKCKRVMMEKTT